MKYLHIVPGADDVANGMARVARLLAKEQGDAEVVDLSAVGSQRLAVSGEMLAVNGGDGKVEPCRSVDGEFGIRSQWLGDSCEEVWVHGMWLPRDWAVCWRVLRAGKRLVRMTHGSLSPVYLKQQGRWKKWLVGPIERWLLRKADRIVATCDAEKAWIEAYLGKKCPEIEVEDVKRFFDFSRVERVEGDESVFNAEAQRRRGAENYELHLLYLGRRHPLKGVEVLETAVSELNSSTPPLPTPPLLKIVSNVFGEELEKVWEWCDVLVLPTLSENFGLVVAEALERGKRVITTDGAPVWGEESDGVGEWVSGGVMECGSDGVMEWRSGGVESRYGGRLLYLKGYRDGSDEERVRLLKDAVLFLAAKV
jgi:glycosyltransferase involved in cell wall biosynthesis